MFDINTNTLCRQYLNILYQNARHSQEQPKTIPETYGEILYESITILLSKIQITDQDIFFDLGSGLGKVVLQVFLNSLVKESCGIEILPELYNISVSIAQQAQQDLPDFFTKDRKLSFLLGSFFEIPLDKASILLISSPCFSPSMFYNLGNIINKTPNIHTVFSLRPICSLTRLKFIKTVRIECSWDTALCYLYSN